MELDFFFMTVAAALSFKDLFVFVLFYGSCVFIIVNDLNPGVTPTYVIIIIYIPQK